MSGVNRGLANLRTKRSVKRYGKTEDLEKGGKIIRNDVPSDIKKRGRDEVNGRNEKGRRMDGRSIKQKRGSIIPAAPMTPERGRDGQKRRKILESGEQGCQPPNQGGSGSQDMNNFFQKKTPLQKDSEICTAATIDEGCSDGQISPTKALRAAKLKKRFADLIFKANHQAVMTQVNKCDPLKLQQERERLRREQIAEQARIEQQIKTSEAVLRIRAEAELKLQRQREREAARIALEKMEKTVEFNDALQIMRDFESLLNSVC